MRGDCLFCWYWWNWWPSLFKLSFHNKGQFSTVPNEQQFVTSGHWRSVARQILPLSPFFFLTWFYCLKTCPHHEYYRAIPAPLTLNNTQSILYLQKCENSVFKTLRFTCYKKTFKSVIDYMNVHWWRVLKKRIVCNKIEIYFFIIGFYFSGSNKCLK